MRTTITAFVLFTLAFTVAGGEPGAEEAALREQLGARIFEKLESTSGGLGKVAVLLTEEGRRGLEGLTVKTGEYLGDLILDAFPWHVEYVDSQHQRDLFELKKLIVDGGVKPLSWVFVSMLRHPNPYVRLHGVLRLEEMNAAEHSARLPHFLRDPDAGVRMAAASALAKFKARGYGEEVASLLDDAEPRVRECAVRNLADLMGRQMLSRIAGRLQDESPRVRAQAAASLDDLQAKSAIPLLDAALERESASYPRRMMESALRSLKLLSGARHELDVETLASGDDSGIREAKLLCIRTPEAWRDLWGSHRPGTPAPEVDFEKKLVIAILRGKSYNSGGINATATEDDEHVVVRFTDLYYQTKGGANDVTPFGFFALPRRGKTIILEEAAGRMLNELCSWEERARFSE